MAHARLYAEDYVKPKTHGCLLGPSYNEGTPRNGLEATGDHVKVWTKSAVQGAFDGIQCVDGQSL